MAQRYLEDFCVGQTFGSDSLRIDEDRIKSFASEFDQQPFHLDAAAVQHTIFHGLAASGWHTAAVTMRLLVESELWPAGGVIGAGFDELRWPHPVRPGDVLRIESEVLQVRPSKSRPDFGLIKVRTTTLNQNGEAVQIFVGNLLVLRRPQVGLSSDCIGILVVEEPPQGLASRQGPVPLQLCPNRVVGGRDPSIQGATQQNPSRTI